MSILTSLLTAGLIALVSPFIAFFTHKHIEQGRRERAYQRIIDEPLIQVGTVLTRLELEGHGQPLMGRCYIKKIEVGRVVIVSEDLTEVMTFTGRELEALHPAIDKDWIDRKLGHIE